MDLADILSEIYIIESLYLRVQKLTIKESTNKETLAIKESILTLQLYMCRKKINEKAFTILDSLSSTKNKKILSIIIKLLTKKQAVNPTILRRKIAKYFIQQGGYNW